MARYARDNRGRFASTGTGATARGAGLRTAAGNKRASVKESISTGGVKGTISKPAKPKPTAPKPTAPKSTAPKPTETPKPALKAKQRLSYERAYHGTTPDAAAKIQRSGFTPSRDGAQGPGVYITTDKRTAQVYANLAAAAKRGDRNSTITEGTSIVRLRVPKGTRAIAGTSELRTSREDTQAAIGKGKAQRLALSGGRSDIVGPAKAINPWVVKSPTIPKTKTKREAFDEYIRTGQRPKPLRITRTKPKR